MPDNIKNQYQYYTKAELKRLREDAGYTKAFTTLEDGVKDYVCTYLDADDKYL